MQVIFDLGKVLIDYDFEIFFRSVGCEPNKRSLEEAEEPLMNFDAGKLNRADFYLSMQKIFGFNVDKTAFEKAWTSVFSPLEDMLQLAEEISVEHDVYILSNTDEIHFPYIWNNFPQLHLFTDNLMLSYELKAVKPDPEIYHLALQKFNLKPENCIFIDDKYLNVNAAEFCGLKAIWHKSFEQTQKELSNILTKND